MKEECSPYSSNYSNNEGNPALSAVLRSVEYICVIITFLIFSFDSRIIGGRTSEPVDDNEDIIDLKYEPVEVSYYVL